MNILVANNHLQNVGGSEMYTFDLIKALKSFKDISIQYFTFEKGEVSRRIEEDHDIPFMNRKYYDLILASHNTCVERLRKFGYTVQICHGILPGLEEPHPDADHYVAISEEISEILQHQCLPHVVLLNGIDVREKLPFKEVNNEPKTILSLCQSERANSILSRAAKSLGISFRSFHKHVNPKFSIEEEINKSDMVVGIGRSVYDAMACGRPCIIYDSRQYNGSKGDGYLTPGNFNKYVKNNCSGRYLNRNYTEQNLIHELKKYNADDGKVLREIATRQLNVYKIAEKLLALKEHHPVHTRDRSFTFLKARSKNFFRQLIH